jgi:hypothetical protein
MLRSAAVVGLALTLGTASAEDPPDVHEIETALDERGEATVTLTGRFYSLTAGRMSLVGSKIEFRYRGRPTGLGRGKCLKLSGKVFKEDAVWIFDVTELSVIPADADRLSAQKLELDALRKSGRAGDVQGLEMLAVRARALGEWYEDPQLDRLAAAWTAEARVWEVDNAMQAKDDVRLLEFSKRLFDEKGDKAEIARLRHAALAIRLGRLDAENLAAWEALAGEVAALLPGADTPLEAFDAVDLAAYAEDPLAAYQRAGESERGSFHRMMWVYLTMHVLERLAEAPGADLDALARRAATALPEHPQLAQRFQFGRLEQLAAEPDRLKRGKMLEVHRGLEQHDRSDLARTLAERWLAHERRGLAENDAEGRAVLADDYQDLLQDKATALVLYLEAIRLAPEHDRTQQGLTSLGYVEIAGQWRPKSSATLPPPEPDPSPPEEIKVGLTAQQVRAISRKPDRVSTTLNARKVREQWLFLGVSPLIVVFEGDAGMNNLRVTAVWNIHAPE